MPPSPGMGGTERLYCRDGLDGGKGQQTFMMFNTVVSAYSIRRQTYEGPEHIVMGGLRTLKRAEVGATTGDRIHTQG